MSSENLHESVSFEYKTRYIRYIQKIFHAICTLQLISCELPGHVIIRYLLILSKKMFSFPSQDFINKTNYLHPVQERRSFEQLLFVQALPELYELSKFELNYLWESNKGAMFFFTLGEILNSGLPSLQEQLECVKLFKLAEFDEGGSFALAPSVTNNLLARIFNNIFPVSNYFTIESIFSFFFFRTTRGMRLRKI